MKPTSSAASTSAAVGCLKTPAGAPAAAGIIIGAARPASAPGVRAAVAPWVGPGRRPASAEIRVHARPGGAIVVAQDAVERDTLQGAAQDSPDHASDDLSAAADGSPWIVITDGARAIARSLEFSATARHFPDFASD